MPEFSFDGSSLDALARDLREGALRLRAETDKTLVKVVEEVAVTARQIASRHSQSIPGKIATKFDPGIGRIVASAPLAAPYELGNKGKRRQDTFWHPVFGNRNVTIAQKRYPFLAPARAANRTATSREMGAAWEQALKPFARKG